MRILPYRTLHDRIEGVIITFSDVTRLKQFERERRELESRMLQTQKLESLGVLAGGIAHDFNNILTAVVGSLDLAMLNMPADGPIRPYLETAQNCTQRAAKITGQMLAYAGGGVMELQRVDFNGIVRDIRALLEASISKMVPLEYQLADTPLAVRADASQLTQVILNLVINAAEACEGHAGSITISTKRVRQDGRHHELTFPEHDPDKNEFVLLEVSDTGCGMDQDLVDRMCEPFFTTKFTGRGLGLAVVEGIVKSHHGAIAVDSEPERGSIFRVILPTDPAEAAIPAPEVAAGVTPITGSARILIIDDEPSVRQIAAEMLDHAGFTVVAAPNGAEGLVALRQRPTDIDLVLLDVTMPGMAAEDVLAGLHAIRGDIPVVLCSGYAEQAIVARFAGQNVAGFIQKPFSLSTLVAGILRWS